MIQQILPNLYAFFSPNCGSNSYLLKGQKNVLIDLSLQENSPFLQNLLQEAGLEPENVDYTWFTHGHTDHLGNADFFKNSQFRMHQEDAKNLEKINEFFPPGKMPKITSFFKENEVIDLGSFQLRVFFTPGHTAGSVCFYEEEKKLLFSGDTLFASGFGRTDLPSGSSEDLANSLQKLKKLNFDLFLPGHGPATKSGFQENIENALKTLL